MAKDGLCHHPGTVQLGYPSPGTAIDKAHVPRSEPEAAALLGVARAFKPHVWMNAHSGMEALFMPYDHLPHIPEGEPAQATLQVGTESVPLC